MNETMLVDVLVFAAGMTALVTVGRLIQALITRKSVPPPQLSSLSDRLLRIEQIVEASAIEIERISESQRFVTKLLGERTSTDVASLGSGPRGN